MHTGVWKDPVQGRCRVGKLNLDGDGQGDLAGHGGEHRAVFVYQFDSYRYWQEQLHRTDFVYGQFGENFTVEGLPDDGVYIGDRYRIGSALFEVTQPRVTCYRVGIRMNEPRMAAFLTSSGRPGFYFRVLEEGEVGAGDEIVTVDQGKERMSVAEVNALLYSPQHPRDRLERALQIAALSPGWRSSFIALLSSRSDGNAGLAPASAAHPAAPGFRPLKVTAIDQEAADVVSLTMQCADGEPLPEALSGQYVVLRLPGVGAPLFRSYSLSGPVSTERYRISVKIEPNGAAGAYLRRPCAGGRCSRGQLAAWELCPAVRRGARGAPQRRDRSDARSGDALRHVVSACDASAAVAARGTRRKAPSIRGRGTATCLEPAARSQLCLFQPTRGRRPAWSGL